jgi:hypothetical protein
MSRLASLIESRKVALEDINRLLDEQTAILNERSLTAEEITKRSDAEARVTQLQEAVVAEEVRDTAATADLEARNRLGAENAGTETGTKPVPEKRGTAYDNGKKGPVHIRLGIEPMTYSKANPENSFYRDLFFASTPGMPGFYEAQQRLMTHHGETTGIMRNSPNSKEGRMLGNYFNEAGRRSLKSSHRGESRDVSTGLASLGDFAPPLYFLDKYAPFRTYGRTLLSILKGMPLPETGMVFNLPKVTTPTEATNQTTSTQGAGENTTVSTRDMTSSYETGALQTIIDNLLVSQQYLDRVGPGIAGDEIVRDDQTRQLNRVLNGYAWGALLGMSGNGAINWVQQGAGSAVFNQNTIAEFKRQTHGAKAAIRRTDGTVAYPTHFITDADVWEQVEGSYDTNGRPYTVAAGVAFNPLAFGDDAGAPEGYSGYKFGGLPAFVDEAAWVYGGQPDNIVIGSQTAASATLSTHAAIVGAFDIACYWMEGPPVIRVLPQPYASTLTVLIQQYCYAALVPVYPAAVQVIYGAPLADAVVTSY